jgi:hypothetical protein
MDFRRRRAEGIYLTIRTEQEARRIKFSAVLPATISSTDEAPLAPTTIKSAFHSPARLKISVKARPSFISVVTFRPLSSSDEDFMSECIAAVAFSSIMSVTLTKAIRWEPTRDNWLRFDHVNKVQRSF